MKWKGESREKLLRCQSKTLRSITFLWSIKSVRRKVVATPFCIVALITIVSWTFQSRSCALHSFLCLIAFDVLSLLGDIFSQFYVHGGKQSTTFSFGLVRVEVLTHFSVLCLGLLLNTWAFLNAIELAFVEPTSQEIHTGRFLPTVIIGGAVHFFLSFSNSPFQKVYKISSSTTTLHKYFQGICASFGLSLSSSNSFSLSPLTILGLFCCNTVILLTLALQSGATWFDFVGSVLMVLTIFDTLWPLCVYTGHILLQTVPSHTATQLEQSIREAITIDGVLEFRNELFWTLSYGQIAGTLHVRVRKDADEQLVLSKVYEKLQPLAPHLTVQIIKDDFGRQFHAIHRNQDTSSLTKSKSETDELSPIPKLPGVVNSVTYYSSSSISSQTPYSATQILRENDIEVNITGVAQSLSMSTLQDHVEPKQQLGADSSQQYSLKLPHQVRRSPIYNEGVGLHNQNPFTASINTENLLMSSANNFFQE